MSLSKTSYPNQTKAVSKFNHAIEPSRYPMGSVIICKDGKKYKVGMSGNLIRKAGSR